MAKEKQEYDYEGDMAMSQLKSIIANAQRIHDMLERDTNIPEWVQSKITLAEDYISTAANYMQGEMKEEYSKSTAIEQRMHSIIAHPVHGRILSNAKYQKGGSPSRPYISAKAFADKTAARHNKHDSDRTYTVHKLYPDSESTQHIIKVSGPKRTGYFAEEGEGGPVNVAANVADPKNKRLFAKPMKRFKSFKAQ